MYKFTQREKENFVRSYLSGNSSMEQAAKYARISRKEFERWLKEVAGKKKNTKQFQLKQFIERLINERSH